MLDHSDPPVVRVLGVRGLAGHVGGQLVEIAELHFLELVVLVVNDRSDVRSWRHRALHALGFGVARELKIRKWRNRRRACVGNFVGDFDDVAASAIRLRLHDLIAIACRGL